MNVDEKKITVTYGPAIGEVDSFVGRIRYEGSFAIITESNGEEVAIPSHRVRGIKIRPLTEKEMG